MDLLELYLDDALHSRLWVDCNELLTFQLNFLKWISCYNEKLYSHNHINIQNNELSLSDISSDGEEEVLEGDTNNQIPQCSGTNFILEDDAVIDRYSTDHKAAEELVLINLKNRLSSPTFLKTSSGSSGTTSIIKTISSFAGLASIRLLASSYLEKWMNNPVFADLVRDLVQTIAVFIRKTRLIIPHQSPSSSIQEKSSVAYLMSDADVIRTFVILRGKVPSAKAEWYKAALLQMSENNNIVTDYILKVLFEEAVTDNTTRQETIQLMTSVLQKYSFSKTSDKMNGKNHNNHNHHIDIEASELFGKCISITIQEKFFQNLTIGNIMISIYDILSNIIKNMIAAEKKMTFNNISNKLNNINTMRLFHTPSFLRCFLLNNEILALSIQKKELNYEIIKFYCNISISCQLLISSTIIDMRDKLIKDMNGDTRRKPTLAPYATKTVIDTVGMTREKVPLASGRGPDHSSAGRGAGISIGGRGRGLSLHPSAGSAGSSMFRSSRPNIPSAVGGRAIHSKIGRPMLESREVESKVKQQLSDDISCSDRRPSIGGDDTQDEREREMCKDYLRAYQIQILEIQEIIMTWLASIVRYAPGNQRILSLILYSEEASGLNFHQHEMNSPSAPSTNHKSQDTVGVIKDDSLGVKKFSFEKHLIPLLQKVLCLKPLLIQKVRHMIFNT